ncbi:MAG: succinate dehydrogenase, cytochrome b556 subunit [Gammaproteobacteria bacterium]|nr:succinate dehydrogenase, cytochrome b556 subunit [Gammaproteobacteria bacterium]
MTNQNNRPTSPHLQVYRLPMTALISITHRATGAALSLGAVLLVWVLSSVAVGGDYYATMHSHLSAWYGQIVLFGFTFALFFHFCHGIRHLLWDTGWGLEIEAVAKSDLVVLGGAVVLTLATWLVALTAG